MNKNYFLYTLLLFLITFTNAQTTDVLTGLSFPQGIVLNGNDLYIAIPTSNTGKVVKIDITQSTPTPIDVVTGLNAPRQLALDGNTLYISENNENRIVKVDISSSLPITPEIVVTGVASPQGILVDNDFLYIVETSPANKISKVDLTAFSLVAVDVATQIAGGNQIALYNNMLYVAQFSLNKVSKIDLSAANPTAEDVILIDQPTALFLDETELYIAHSSSIPKKISKLDVTATTSRLIDVITDLENPVAMALTNNELYISEITFGKIVKVSIPDLDVNCDLNYLPSPVNIPANTSSLQWGQSFTADCNGSLEYVQFAAASAGTTNGNTLSIYVGDGTATTPIYTQAFSDIIINNPGDPIRINLNNTLNVLKGNQYTFAFSVNNVGIRFGDNGYDGGMMWQQGSSIGSPNLDMQFGIGINENNSLSTNEFNNTALVFFPNPVKDYLQVKGLNTVTLYSIYAVDGTLLSSGSISNHKKIDVTQLGSGLYFLRIDNSSYKFTK